MKVERVKDVLNEDDLERFARTLLGDMNQDFVADVFISLYLEAAEIDADYVIDDFNATNDEDLVRAMVEFLGDVPVHTV